MLIDLSANALLDELAARGEIPGGGSALALALAAAAAIVEMAARISASSWADGVGVAAQAAQLRARAAGLVDADADAYGEVLAMRDVVGTMPVEDRDREVGRAFTAAAEPPLAVARVAAEVAELADLVAARGDEHVHVDAAVAAALAAAAARGGLALVAANLTTRADDPRVEEAARLAESAEQSALHALA